MSKESAIRFGVNGEPLVGTQVWGFVMEHFAKQNPPVRAWCITVVDEDRGTAVGANTYCKPDGQPYFGAGYDHTKYSRPWPLDAKQAKKFKGKGYELLTATQVAEEFQGLVLLRTKEQEGVIPDPELQTQDA